MKLTFCECVNPHFVSDVLLSGLINCEVFQSVLRLKLPFSFYLFLNINILNLSFSLDILVCCMAIENYYHRKNNLVTFFFFSFYYLATDFDQFGHLKAFIKI